MHNWEHFGRLPAYLLAATLVASCGGGGGDSLLNITGVSDANVALTAVGALVAELATNGEATVELKLTDVNKLPLIGKAVQLKLEGTGVKLSTNTVTTNNTGSASFKISGLSTAAVGTKGTVSATYTDAKGDNKTAFVSYSIVDVANLQSTYKLQGCFEKGSNCVSSASLTVSGADSIASAKFILTDSSDKPLVGKEVTFKLLTPTGGGNLLTQTGTTITDGSVIARVQAASVASSNFLLATIKDVNGVETTTSLRFDTIIGNQVSLVSAKNELVSGGDSIDLMALVVSASGNVQPKVPVFFSLVNPTEKGVTLKNTEPLTDDSGKAKATLTLDNVKGADFSDHVIKVKASIGSGADYREDIIELAVTGTSIDLTTPTSSVKIGAEPVVTAVLKNGKGQVVADQEVVFTSNDIIDLDTGLPLNKKLRTTTQGQITLSTLRVTTNKPTATIKAAGLNVETALAFDVSARNFEMKFVKNGQPVTKIDIAEGGMIELIFKDDSGASIPDAISVTVSTTLGTILPPTVLTKVNGSENERKASIQLTSAFPGSATVRASIDDAQTNSKIVATGTVQLVSKIADKLAIQAVTPILAPNGQTNIIAKVRDANDNPVQDVDVNFSLKNPLGGTLNTPVVVTNSKGEASVTFTAGSDVTGTEKVEILAKVPEQYTNFTGDRPASLNLTVGGEAVFISIATGNEIEEITSTTYAVPYQVTVTDATGAPVANKEIKLSVWPVNYYKGVYLFSDEKKLWVVEPYSAQCSNEDANQNGVLDSWENNKVGNALSALDYPVGQEVDVEDNGDGKLWPGNPVTLSTSTLKTGADGIAYFNVLYGQSYANWLRVKLTAKAQVSGTESKAETLLGLPASSTDMTNDKVSPPGGTTSVFGSANACSNPN